MKKAIVWGLGKNYSDNPWIHKRYEIIALTDTNTAARARYSDCGILVICPSDIYEQDFDVVIVTPWHPHHRETIKNELISKGMEAGQIEFVSDKSMFLSDKHKLQTDNLFRLDNSAQLNAVKKDRLFCLDNFDEIILQPISMRAGNVMMNQLLSDHPSLISLPTFFLSRSFYYDYISSMRYLKGKQLAAAVLSACALYSNYENSEHTLYDAQGQKIQYSKIVNAELFCMYFYKYILMTEDTPNFGYIFKALHAAYANSLGKHPDGKRYIIYHHSHIWNLGDIWLSNFFTKVTVLTAVRDPLRAGYSQINYQWLNLQRYGKYLAHDWFDSFVFSMPFYPEPFWADGRLCYYEVGDTVNIIKTDFTHSAADPFELVDHASDYIASFLKDVNVVIVRFEDIKTNIEGTMKKVCEMLDIPYDPVVLKTTQAGIEVFTKGYEKSTYVSSANHSNLITASDTAAIQPITFDKHFNNFDLFRLEMIFKEFSEIFGYPSHHIPSMADFDRQTLLKLFSYPLKSLNNLNNIDENTKRANTLFFLMFSYLQSRIIQVMVEYGSGDCLVETGGS